MAKNHLPEYLKEAGSRLLKMTDALQMRAQGAMWIYDYGLEEWRYYLVTSLVDTLGRKKTYSLLLSAFERLGSPRNMVPDDVYLGSPGDAYFLHVSTAIGVGSGVVELDNCLIDGTPIDALIYRAVRAYPSAREANAIEKTFSKRVKDLQASSEAGDVAIQGVR